MSLHSISLEQLEALEKNQEACQDLPPVTTRATFKLSRILELIAEIVQHPDFKPDDQQTHNICITFVRQVQNNNVLGFHTYPEMTGKTKNGEIVTQLVPIITGCIMDLQGGKFRYLRSGPKRENVYFLRPGGEGSGLIPPPPPDDENFK